MPDHYAHPPPGRTPPGNASPPPAYSGYYRAQFTGEQTPLLPQANIQQNKAQTQKRGNWMLYLTFLVFMALQVYFWIKATTVEDALDPATRDRIRRDWAKETRAHETIRQEWSMELADHERIRVGWESERQELIAMREQLVRDKEAWMREREEEKGAEERRKREEEDRTRAQFAWEDLKGNQGCLQYRTKRYTARLANVPREYDPVKACTETSVEIHGAKIPSPHQCEDRGCGGVFGHWIVDSEPTCTTHFDYFNDKGCMTAGSRRRRFESHLENLQSGDNWRDMCYTTPANFRNMHFGGPDMCVEWGKYGIWGLWNVEDENC